MQLSAAQPGLRPRELDRSARRDLLASLRRRELAVGGIDAWVPPGHLLDPARVDRAVAALAEAIDLAGDLGRCPLSVALPRTEAEAEEGMLAPVRQALVARADHRGVPVADHALPLPDDTALGIGIDPAAWLSRDEDPAGAVAALGERLVSLRLCDLLASGMRGPIGDAREGRLDVTAYRVAAGVAGYTRPVVVDARQWADPIDGVLRSRDAWERAAPGSPAR